MDKIKMKINVKNKKRHKKQTHFTSNRNITDITNDNYNEYENNNINENHVNVNGHLFAVEFFKAFPICNKCSKHVFNWFCPC